MIKHATAKSRPAPATAQRQIKPTSQKASLAHQTTIPQYPSGEPPCRSRGGHRATKIPIFSRAWHPFSVSPPRSRALAPQTSSRLARGSRPLERVSASLGASLRPQCPACSPDRGIKCSDAPWVPGSKANARHADLLTQPGNPIPALFKQPAVVPPSPMMCECCAGWPVSLCCTVPPTLSFLHAATLEKGRRRPRKAYCHQLSARPR
jgi:hypothetical protein